MAALLAGLVLVWSSQTHSGPVSVRQMAEAGQSAFFILNLLQIVAVLAIAPAATAGAICLDRSRGTLDHVFTTDLSNREIILGKLAARLGPVWALIACTLPVAMLATWLGGIDPQALIGSFLVTIGLAFLGCTLALLLSVRASRPQEVLTVVFSIWAIWLLAYPMIDITLNLGGVVPAGLIVSNPFTLTMLPYTRPGQSSLVEPVQFCLACLGIGTICTWVAIRQVRVVGDRVKKPRPRSIRHAIATQVNRRLDQLPQPRGPRLDPDPIYWREWHRNRPARWSRWVWVGFRLFSAGSGVTLVLLILCGQIAGPQSELPSLALGALATLGLLLVSTGTASVLAEERTRGSLDVLLCTPISTRAILKAKWRGAWRPVTRLTVWPLIVGLAGLTRHEFAIARIDIVLLVSIVILAQGAALVSLGLALATWIKRTGQATAWTVAAYVIAVVGWPIVGIYLPLDTPARLQARNDFIGMILFWIVGMGSPFFNTTLALVVAGGDAQMMHGDQEGILVLLATWIFFYGGLAWVLFEATVRTFDRCLGRTSERPDRSQVSLERPQRWSYPTNLYPERQSP